MNTGLIEQPDKTSEGGSMLDVAASRSAQEIQAAVLLAKRFPRDVNAAYQRIMNSCKRKKLAEQALYAYPRGGTMVTGPSIRLAEELARGWGNMDFGVVELEQKAGESICMAYAWDLETNTRQTKVFTVSHFRQTKTSRYLLTDPRDIYETVANQGARRMRACVLAIIPGDIQEEAIEECQRTLKGSNNEPLSDRVRKMVAKFAELGISQVMIEGRLGHNIDSVLEIELVNLRGIYQSIKDGMSSVDDNFKRPEPTSKGAKPKKSPTEDLADRLGEENQEPPVAAEDESQEPPEAAAESQTLGSKAHELIDRISRAETKEALQAAWNDANQLKLAKQLSEYEFAEVKKERDATTKKLKK